jgi:Dyp-type peroxidase family
MPSDLDRAAVQGLVVSSFAHLECAAYRLLRVEEPVRARRWLASVAEAVTCGKRRQEGWSLNLALSWPGLQALGFSASDLDPLPTTFTEGMASARRSRILGDTDRSHSDHWAWGKPAAPVHALLLMYGRGETELAREKTRWKPEADSGITEVLTLDAGRQPDAREHFGFMDGVGQPVVAGSGRLRRQLDRTGHATELPAGEFVLGYHNAYGFPSPGPTISASLDPEGVLPPSAGAPGRRDLGRNGSFLVFRQLAQDVAGFWQFVTTAAASLWPGDPEGPTRLASKLVGRWPSGAPLVLHPNEDAYRLRPRKELENDFAYADRDPHGLACPLGSHIRRANPRDSLGPTSVVRRASANRHRLLRRGRSYGHRLKDPMRDDGEDRGLHFICLVADIERQYEFVQQNWINNPSFAGLCRETDPLVGDQSHSGHTFSVQADPLRLRVPGLRTFVTVRGGGYFLLPGIAALRFLFPSGTAGEATQ